MPKGIYKHKQNQGFQKGHARFGSGSTGKHWKYPKYIRVKMSKGWTLEKKNKTKQNSHRKQSLQDGNCKYN